MSLSSSRLQLPAFALSSNASYLVDLTITSGVLGTTSASFSMNVGVSDLVAKIDGPSKRSVALSPASASSAPNVDVFGGNSFDPEALTLLGESLSAYTFSWSCSNVTADGLRVACRAFPASVNVSSAALSLPQSYFGNVDQQLELNLTLSHIPSPTFMMSNVSGVVSMRSSTATTVLNVIAAPPASSTALPLPLIAFEGPTSEVSSSSTVRVVTKVEFAGSVSASASTGLRFFWWEATNKVDLSKVKLLSPRDGKDLSIPRGVLVSGERYEFVLSVFWSDNPGLR